MFVKRIFRPIKMFMGLLGVFYDLLQTVSYIGGGIMTAASLVTFFQNIPTIIPIALLVLGILSFGLGIFRTVYRYKMWNSLKNIPELEDVINFPRPYGRGISLLQTSFALHLFYPDFRCMLG